MSTLISILFAVVLNTLSGGDVKQETLEVSNIEIIQCEDSIQQQSHYIISKDEQLFKKK